MNTTESTQIAEVSKDSPKAAEAPVLTEDASPVREDASDAKAQKNKGKYKGKGIDAHGRVRNFYNPPGKVMKQMAQQQYYDNYYVEQQSILKQKFKTQMCKHYTESGVCPLQHYCQFAHGKEELRDPADPLPNGVGKTILGAVHSNYKTQPCKNWMKTGECKFGEDCSFFHNESEKRTLLDPLPNLPEGVVILPMQDKMKQMRRNHHFG